MWCIIYFTARPSFRHGPKQQISWDLKTKQHHHHHDWIALELLLSASAVRSGSKGTVMLSYMSIRFIYNALWLISGCLLMQPAVLMRRKRSIHERQSHAQQHSLVPVGHAPFEPENQAFINSIRGDFHEGEHLVRVGRSAGQHTWLELMIQTMTSR